MGLTGAFDSLYWSRYGLIVGKEKSARTSHFFWFFLVHLEYLGHLEYLELLEHVGSLGALWLLESQYSTLLHFRPSRIVGLAVMLDVEHAVAEELAAFDGRLLTFDCLDGGRMF